MSLTNTQIPRLFKAFEKNCSDNTKLSKIQLNKIGKSGGFLGRHLGPFTLHLEANKYLSKIRKSSSCIFSKYYMLTDKKQKNENFLLGGFLMWA